MNECDFMMATVACAVAAMVFTVALMTTLQKLSEFCRKCFSVEAWILAPLSAAIMCGVIYYHETPKQILITKCEHTTTTVSCLTR